jgi:hypothetical protein
VIVCVLTFWSVVLFVFFLFDIFPFFVREDDCTEARGEERDGERNEEKQTPPDAVLLDACRSGSLSEIEAALIRCASINATDECERTGLSLACRRKYWELLCLLCSCCLPNDLSPQYHMECSPLCCSTFVRRSCSSVVGKNAKTSQSYLRPTTFCVDVVLHSR